MKEISTEELRELISKRDDLTLLDCRAADYFHWERLPNAKNLRWKKIAQAPQSALPSKESMIVTYCQSFLCTASTQGYQALEQRGFKNVVEYSGGIEDWKAHGGATESTPNLKIAPNVYRFPDQEYFGESVGSYVLEQDDFILLFDGPMTLTEENEDFILGFGKPIRILLSHGPTAGDAKKLQMKHKARVFLHKADARNKWLTLTPDVLFEGALDLGGDLEVIHLPGHSPGSVGLLDRSNRILFTGDAVGGTADGAVYDFVRHDRSDDIRARMRSVEKMLKLPFDSVYPFHYEPLIGNAKDILSKFIHEKRKEV